MSPHLLIAILIGGMVAGILDIGAAAAINRKGPVAILHVIASGLLGPKALKGGSLTSALGFLLQLAMSIIIAAIYGLASLWLPILARAWITTGLAYGVGVFVVMWSCPALMDGLGLRRACLGHHVSFRIRWAKDTRGPNGDGTGCRSLR